MNEVWKDIDDRYSVSNLGRIKSNYANKERILKPYSDARGYLKVDIRHGEFRKSKFVHRLVAEAFIPNPNPEQLNEVNHKDENKTNNCVENLEWCNTEYNCNYGTRNKRKAENCKKSICSIDRNKNIVHYSSVIEASEITGISRTSISKALSDNYSNNKTAGGMLWIYDDDNIEQIIKEIKFDGQTGKRSVYSIDSNGNIEYFISISEAKRITGINNINRAINTGISAGGRRWFYNK